MTLYDVARDGKMLSHHADNAGPKTHALIIGVGSYLYLTGGFGGRVTTKNMGLGQLTLPPVQPWILRAGCCSIFGMLKHHSEALNFWYHHRRSSNSRTERNASPNRHRSRRFKVHSTVGRLVVMRMKVISRFSISAVMALCASTRRC